MRYGEISALRWGKKLWMGTEGCGCTNSLDSKVAEEAGGAAPGPRRHVWHSLVQPVRLQRHHCQSSAALSRPAILHDWMRTGQMAVQHPEAVIWL